MSLTGRTKMIGIKVSDTERKKLEALAEKHSQTLSEFMRSRALDSDKNSLEECLKILKSVHENQKSTHQKIETLSQQFKYLSRFIFHIRYLVTAAVNTLLEHFGDKLRGKTQIPKQEKLLEYIDKCYTEMIEEVEYRR